MSAPAIATFGIDRSMYRQVVKGSHEADVFGFGRIYISALQLHVTKLTTRVEQLQKEESETRKKYEQKIKHLESEASLKDELLQVYRTKPSAPTLVDLIEL